MRLAGSNIDSFFNSNRPNFAKTAQDAFALRSNEKAAATGLIGELASAGIGAQAKAKAAGITGAAEAQLGQAEAMGQAFSSIGSAVGAAGALQISTGLGNYFGDTPEGAYQGFGKSKYGTFQNPTADFQRAGFTLS